MDSSPEQAVRDRAIWVVRLVTFGSVAGALGSSWVFSGLAVAFFSGKPPAPATAATPEVPVAAAPVQKPPKVVQKVVHHKGWPPGTIGAGPRPPNWGPGPAPMAPPAPVCHSTPSLPC